MTECYCSGLELKRIMFLGTFVKELVLQLFLFLFVVSEVCYVVYLQSLHLILKTRLMQNLLAHDVAV